MSDADVIIIGAGVAGASLAWQLARTHRVLILDQESTPSHHSTGRSAAIQTVYAGTPLISAASLQSRAFLSKPPAGFTEAPILSPRGVLRLSDDAGMAGLEASFALASAKGRPVELLRRAQMLERGYPIAGKVTLGLSDSEPSDIDVDALHQGFLRGAMRQGAVLRLNHRVTAMHRRAGVWHVRAGAETVTAAVVANASGAFSDAVAGMAGAMPLTITPKKRTIAVVPIPEGMEAHGWPLMADAAFSFYMKPERTGLLVSPSDAEPHEAAEAFADEMDVAIAIDRMQKWLDLPVRRVSHSWAGLRSFSEDDDPLIGFDTQAEGFFWCAGQGGFGVQSSPALSEVAACILRGEAVPAMLEAAGLTAQGLSQTRLEKSLT